MPEEPYVMITTVSTVVHNAEEEEDKRRSLVDMLGDDWNVGTDLDVLGFVKETPDAA